MRNPIVHGDFKPSDVLVVANGRIPKITNFGLWDFKNFFIENTMAEDVVFLNPHQAPEVLIGHERPSLCSDVWSLGAVILQWMMERPPWDLQHLCDMYQYRHDRQASALHDAMDNQVRTCAEFRIFILEKQKRYSHNYQFAKHFKRLTLKEEPTVSLYLEDNTLQFLKPCFSYDAISRPKAR